MDRLALPRGNFFLAFLPLLPALVMLTGCVQFVEQKYSDINLPLGKHHYIHVSTFPAWFPSSKDEVHLPYLYSRTRSHDEVYFQLHVKNNRLEGPPATPRDRFLPPTRVQLPNRRWRMEERDFTVRPG